MAAGTAPRFPAVIQNSAVTIVPADTTSEKTVLTAGADGSRVDAVSVCSDDTVARVLKILLNNGSTSYVVGEVTVPIGAGTNAAATTAVKLLSTAYLPWLDPSGSLFLKAGWKLNVAAEVTVTTAKTLTVVASYGDY